MRTTVNSVEIPSGQQRVLDERAIAVVIDGTTTITPANLAGLPVYVMGGTSTASVVFSGSITTDIGNVKLQDQEGNFAVVPTASDGKNGATKALVVQAIDPTGSPLYQATQIAILNSHGTLATQATLLAAQTTLGQVNNSLTSILNSQGTQTSIAGFATEATATRVMNSQGTLATQATLTEINQTVTAVMNSQGTLAEDPTSRDAFGRLRVSEPFTIFDSKQLLDAAPHLWDDGTTSGSGAASAYDRINAKVRLSVAASTAGTRARQTFRRFNYQPGKSQLILMTFTMGSVATGITRRVGYFDDFNGLFLEQSNDGPSFVVRKNSSATAIAQADWNVDKLDGTGLSGITLDLAKSQILFIEFEWLGVGHVNFGFLINGHYVRCHRALHANVATDVYMSAPNLPLRYEISNDGSGAAATFDCICSSVMSEGGAQNTGYPRSIDRGTAAFVTLNSTDLFPIIGLRLSSSGTHATIAPIGASVVCTSNSVIRYALVVNPVISGDTVVWTGINNSAIEYANATDVTGSANIATGGTVVASGYAAASQAATQIIPPNLFGLGTSLRGVADELWLCAARVTGTTESIYGSIYFTAQS